MTIATALAKYSQWIAGKYALSTRYTYTANLRLFANHQGTEKRIGEINVDDFTEWFHHQKAKGISEPTIALRMIALRQFWKFLYDQRLTEFTYELIPVPRAVTQHFVHSDKEDLDLLLDVIPSGSAKDLRDQLVIRFLYSSGVRVSELCDLRISDLRLADQYAVIRRKKNRRLMPIFWDDETQAILLTYLEHRVGIALDDHVIINFNRGAGTYRRLTPRSVQRIIKDYRELAGIEKQLTPHSFRHGFGMDLAECREVTPHQVRDLLGHVNLASQDIYTRVRNPKLQEAYKTVKVHRE